MTHNLTPRWAARLKKLETWQEAIAKIRVFKQQMPLCCKTCAYQIMKPRKCFKWKQIQSVYCNSSEFLHQNKPAISWYPKEDASWPFIKKLICFYLIQLKGSRSRFIIIDNSLFALCWIIIPLFAFQPFFPFQPSRLSPSSTQQSQCHVASPALAIWQQITPSIESAGNVQICHVTQLCRVANTKKSKCVFDRAHTWEHTSQGSTSAMRKKVFGVGEYSPGWSWWRSSHPQGRGCRQLRPHSWRKWSSGWWSQMVWEEG